MTKRVQRVRHDNAGSAAFLGKIGEITVNTGNKSLHVHDGINEGGTEQARADLVNVAVATAANVGKMSAQQAAELAQALLDIVQNTTDITSNDVDIAVNLASIGAFQSSRANKIVPATVDNVAVLDAAGDLADGLKTVAQLLARANHTGTQTLATISDSGALAALNSVGAAQIDTSAVGQSEIAANAVGQSELKDTTGIVSTTLTTGINLTLPSGSFGFYPQFRETGAGLNAAMVTGGNIGSTYITNIRLQTITSGTAYAQQRYFTASPPYDLGDGVVGRFIFVLIDDATKNIDAVYQATEAPWHYNGPTDIRGKLAADGKKYRTHRDMSGHPLSLAQARLNIGTLKAYNVAFQNTPLIQQEITQDIKQADINLIPHPFIHNDLTGKTVVMLDPVSDLNFELDELSQQEEFNINELLHDGYLEIDNVGLQRAGPTDILIPSFKWKNSQ